MSSLNLPSPTSTVPHLAFHPIRHPHFLFPCTHYHQHAHPIPHFPPNAIPNSSFSYCDGISHPFLYFGSFPNPLRHQRITPSLIDIYTYISDPQDHDNPQEGRTIENALITIVTPDYAITVPILNAIEYMFTYRTSISLDHSDPNHVTLLGSSDTISDYDPESDLSSHDYFEFIYLQHPQAFAELSLSHFQEAHALSIIFTNDFINAMERLQRHTKSIPEEVQTLLKKLFTDD